MITNTFITILKPILPPPPHNNELITFYKSNAGIAFEYGNEVHEHPENYDIILQSMYPDYNDYKLYELSTEQVKHHKFMAIPNYGDTPPDEGNNWRKATKKEIMDIFAVYQGHDALLEKDREIDIPISFRRPEPLVKLVYNAPPIDYTKNVGGILTDKDELITYDIRKEEEHNDTYQFVLNVRTRNKDEESNFENDFYHIYILDDIIIP